MAIAQLKTSESLDFFEYKILLTQISHKSIDQTIMNPDKNFFSEKLWNSILHLSNLPVFS